MHGVERPSGDQLLVGENGTFCRPRCNAEQSRFSAQITVIRRQCQQRLLGSQAVRRLPCGMGVAAVCLPERSQMAQQPAIGFDKPHISRADARSAKRDNDLRRALAARFARQLVAAVLQLLLGQPGYGLTQSRLHRCLPGVGRQRGYRHSGNIHIAGAARSQREAAVRTLQLQNRRNQLICRPQRICRHCIGAAVQSNQSKDQTVAALPFHVAVVVDLLDQIITADILRIASGRSYSQRQTFVIRHFAEFALVCCQLLLHAAQITCRYRIPGTGQTDCLPVTQLSGGLYCIGRRFNIAVQLILLRFIFGAVHHRIDREMADLSGYCSCLGIKYSRYRNPAAGAFVQPGQGQIGRIVCRYRNFNRQFRCFQEFRTVRLKVIQSGYHLRTVCAGLLNADRHRPGHGARRKLQPDFTAIVLKGGCRAGVHFL
ncbi:hypothetical protein D3C73_868070 [compost metagenome]